MANVDLLPRLKSVLDYVGGTAAIVAVVGYSSLRAHLNHLGIAGIASLPASLYLYDAYLFLTAWVAIVVELGAPILLAICCSMLVARRFRLADRRWALALAPGWRVAPKAICILAPPLLMAVALWLLPGAEFANLLSRTGSPPTEIARPEIFVLTVLATTIALLIALSSRLYEETARQLGDTLTYALRLFQAAITMILLWVSVVVFNATPPREPDYQLVKLYDRSNAFLTCGLLVLATDGEYVVWGRGISRWETSVWPKAAFRAAVFASRWKLGAFRDDIYGSECGGAATTGSSH
jgi:hypothetical protein